MAYEIGFISIWRGEYTYLLVLHAFIIPNSWYCSAMGYGVLLRNNKKKMVRKITYLYYLLILWVSTSLSGYGQTVALRGTVLDGQSRKALDYATVQLYSEDQFLYGGVTDANGHFGLKQLAPGTYRVVISYLGYDAAEKKLNLVKDCAEVFYLNPSVLALSEVVVTASESKSAKSASVVDRTAMKHLQPSSFSDLMELVPGGKAVDPQMGEANLIRIREAGNTENFSSLGVGFYVDGIAQSTDANLQQIPNSTSSVNATSTMSKGVDMRTISTDDIEKVEIIRGIPSVAYGNVANGAVLIQRKATESPLTARFKADKTSKLFSVGKGFRLDGSGRSILNAGLSYLDSKIDPRNSVKNYTRFTASARLNGTGLWNEQAVSWNISADYTGSFDKAKRDKDASVKEDAYGTDFSSLKISGKWTLKFPADSWFREVRATYAISQQWEEMNETKSVSLNRPTAIAIQTESGEHDGMYLPYNYVAQMKVDGKPLYITAAIRSQMTFPLRALQNQLNVGVEWNYQKNLGEGQVFDVTHPISESLTTRPRRFKEIPGLQPFAVYAEEVMTLPIKQHSFILTGGIRVQSLLGLNSSYKMQGKLYADPRFDIQWKLPHRHGWEISFSGGLGWMSRMPVTAQLYPDVKYVDLVQLNYYHNNPSYRRINMMTYKWDNANYQLEPARNRKWEIRTDLAYKGNRLSVTYFRECMNNGFDEQTYYKSLAYKLYDPASINGSVLTAPPELAQFSYSDESNIDVYSTSGNTLKVRKEGVEFQFASKRMEVLKTRITVYGAWIKTIYSSDVPRYKSSSILLDNKQLKYVGLYVGENGVEGQSFNTNFMFDTYIQRLGLTFSTSAQCTWFTSRKNLWNDGTPVSYVDKFGTVHPFREEDKENVQLQHLVEHYSAAYFDRTTVPFYMDINLKASKQLGKYINLSLYVNRILGVYPDYTLRGVLQRRTAVSPYFGMEMNLTF